MKSLFLLTFAAAALVGCQPAPVPEPHSGPAAATAPSPAPSTGATTATPSLAGALQPDLQTAKKVYTVGEKIEVTVIAVGLTDTAWVWLVPEEIAVKPTARPAESPHPSQLVSAGTPMELVAAQPGRYQLYLFPSSELSAPLASRAVEIQ